MGKKSTDAAEELLLKKITDHLKSHNLHGLRGEVVPTKRKIGGEVVNFIPDLYIPEVEIPVELTVDKDRDDDYLSVGLLPMVVTESRMRFDTVEEYVDSFLDFHKKWNDSRI